MTTSEIINIAVENKGMVAVADTDTKRNALNYMADALIENKDFILEANKEDIAVAKGVIPDTMIDRLLLDEKRIMGMTDGIRQVSTLENPVGILVDSKKRPNGLTIDKVSVPMGVIAIIYESRPNVTSDAAALGIMAGSAVILRCGKEAHRSADAIVQAMQSGLDKAGLPKKAVQLVDDVSRNSASELMSARGKIDLLIPRGGKGLISACVENAKVPVLETGTGICHVFIDKDAEIEKALNIIENAKCSRPSVCNAAECCLIHREIAEKFLPLMKKRLVDDRANNGLTPVRLKLDRKSLEIIDGEKASKIDFDTEFLDYILAVKIVDNVEEAVNHISEHSTGHSEAIVSENPETQNIFTNRIDSAAVYVNASTRFTDGGEFGLGCEMGISTQKLHARGPLGLRELCSFKYIVHGNGQTR